MSKRQKRPEKLAGLMAAIKAHLAADKYLDTRHAFQRQLQRDVTRPEIEFVLTNGHHEPSRDRWDEAYRSWSYAIEGQTQEGRKLRVIVAIDEETGTLIITVVDLNV